MWLPEILLMMFYIINLIYCNGLGITIIGNRLLMILL
nr:MAG TPA: hypothetical protein [Caudoviricetes sp.]